MKIKILTTTLLSFIILGVFIFAGFLTAPTPAPEPTFYTLEDIYNLIHNNTPATEGNHSLAPSVPTTSTSSYSISQLYADLANLIKRENLETNYQVLGVTGNYDNPDPDYATTTIIFSSLTPDGTPGEAYSYSLEDIWNLIDSSATTTPNTHEATPSDTNPTMHTLTDIYTALTTLIDPAKVKADVIYLGQTGKYVPDPYAGYFVFEVTTTESPQTFGFNMWQAGCVFIDWGDETPPDDSCYAPTSRTHSYASPNTYTIRVSGETSRIVFGGESGNTPTLLSDILTPVSDGITGINDASYMFVGTTVESFTATDFFDEASVGITNMSYMFSNSSFNQDISNWDTSSVIDMSLMFNEAVFFNQDLSGWNVSNVNNYTNFDTGATAWDPAFKPVFGQ